MIRMREPVTCRSEAPLLPGKGEEFHLSGVEVENGRGGLSVHPAATFTRIHDEGLAARLHFLPMQVAVDDDLMRLDRPLRHVRQVMNEKNAAAADLEAVRGLEELEADRLLRPGAK